MLYQNLRGWKGRGNTSAGAYTTKYIGIEMEQENVSARSAGAYTACNFVCDSNYIERGWECTPQAHQPGLICLSSWNVRQKLPLCVYSVCKSEREVNRLCKRTSSTLVYTTMYINIRKIIEYLEGKCYLNNKQLYSFKILKMNIYINASLHEIDY
jgi:hypothetical protein